MTCFTSCEGQTKTPTGAQEQHVITEHFIVELTA